MKPFKIMERIKIKKVFSELLFSYIIVLLIPLVMAIGFSVAAHKIYLNKSFSDAQNNLANGMAQFEKLLEKIDTCGNYLTYDSSLLQMENLPALTDGDQNIYSILQFRKYLAYAFLDADISDNYALLLSNDYVFNSSTTVTSLEFYYKYYCKYEDMTCEEFLDASFQTSSTFFFPLQNMVKEKITYRVLTYNYGIKNKVSQENTSDAVLQVHISESSLKEMFINVLSYNGCTIYIMDADGSVLAMLGEDFTHQPNVSQFSEDQGYLTVSGTEGNQIVFYDQSSSRNLAYAAVIPEATIFASAQQLSLISYLLMILCLIVEILLGIRFARRYSTPIHNLLNNFERMLGQNPFQKLPDNAKRSELGDLEANVSYVLDTNASLQKAMKEKQWQSFLDYLLNGEFQENEVILKESVLAGIPLGNMTYSVASFKLNNAQKYVEILSGRAANGSPPPTARKGAILCSRRPQCGQALPERSVRRKRKLRRRCSLHLPGNA
ncbi:MAG: hypothetical protein LUH07_01650 [Lachnospiraceae bacterium]|nr:hypothetical protein [Lachnospiraceae bacterium]